MLSNRLLDSIFLAEHNSLCVVYFAVVSYDNQLIIYYFLIWSLACAGSGICIGCDGWSGRFIPKSERIVGKEVALRSQRECCTCFCDGETETYNMRKTIVKHYGILRRRDVHLFGLYGFILCVTAKR